MLLVAASVMGLWQRHPVAPRPSPIETVKAEVVLDEPVVIPEVFAGTLEPLDPARAPVLKKIVKARFETTRGPLLIETYPEAAPRAAARFIELIRLRFYDDTPLFRVVPRFVVQFGINSRMAAWKDRAFADDPSLFRLGPGTLAFAKAGPDTNSTQVFLNFGDNSQLAQQGGFTAFAKVTRGFERTFEFKQVAEAEDQAALWEDTAGLLKGLPRKPDQIVSARLMP